LGAGRVRTQRDVGDTVHDVCASLHFNEYLIDPAEMMNGTAGYLKLSLSYPNLFNLVLQVRDIRVCNMNDGRSLNLKVSDRVFCTWRCWVSDDILGRETNGMRKGSIIHIRNYALQYLPRIGICTMVIKAVQVLSGGGQIMGEPTSLDGSMGNCMEAPGDRSTSMEGLVEEYRSLGGGCCPIVLRNGAETIAFIDPTLEITIVGREAADFLRIGRRMSPEGIIFEQTQLYLRSTLSGCAQPFRVTPLHALGGPLIFGRDLLEAHRLTQGTGPWAIMTQVKIILDPVPDDIDSQECDDLMVPLADIKRLCRLLDRSHRAAAREIMFKFPHRST
jgi:hypothetical protein